VAGILYRTGPGSYKVPGTDYERHHWFDGFSTVHRFELIAQPDGTCKVRYNSHTQCDRLIELCRKTGKLDGVSFGQKRDPCESIFHKVKTVFGSKHDRGNFQNANVGVTIHPNVSFAVLVRKVS
jgi:torulene dioxygenase